MICGANLVRETKSSVRQFDIRTTEEDKITCGMAHFTTLGEVDFKKVAAPADV